MWRGTPLEAVGDNHSPDAMYVRQWDHLNFKDVGGTWHGQLTRAVSGFSWAWTTLVRFLVRTHWYWCLSVAVGVHGSGVLRAPAAVRAYWWRMGVRWLLAPTWCC